MGKCIRINPCTNLCPSGQNAWMSTCKSLLAILLDANFIGCVAIVKEGPNI